MTLDQKIEKLNSLGYPADDFTVKEVNRHYERVIAMNITDSIKNAGNHPRADEYQEGEIDIDLEN